MNKRDTRAGPRAWLEVWHPGDRKPALQDVTNWTAEQVDRQTACLDRFGWAWTLRTGTPPDMEGRE